MKNIHLFDETGIGMTKFSKTKTKTNQNDVDSWIEISFPILIVISG